MLALLLNLVAVRMEELGLTWAIIISGFVGALVSLISLNPGTVTVRQRFVTIGAGIALAWFGTPALGQYWGIVKTPALAGMALLLGMFGLSVVRELYEFIRNGAIKSLLLTFLKMKGPKSK